MKNLISILSGTSADIKKEMLTMGVHPGGISIMLPKSRFKVIKLKDIPVTSANIIKQDMLAYGGEAATHAGTINHSIKKTDVLLFGTDQQIKSLTAKLKSQYFGLKELAFDIEEAIKAYDTPAADIKAGKTTLKLSSRTYIMGILNVTPDSFSDGGKYYHVEAAVEHAEQMLRDGADIIDVGGESTRPGSKSVSVKEEINRVVPVIKRLSKITKAVISIDTTKAAVAEAAIMAGARMINDISGLSFDKKMGKVAAKYKVPVVLMHIQGKPRTMQKNPVYKDLMLDVISRLQNSITLAIKCQIPRRMLIVDPGFGFGKTVEHNLEILKDLKELKVLGCPILVGTSRKSMIGNVLGLGTDERMEGSVATAVMAAMNGASIIRAHDVKETKRALTVCDRVQKG
jgi:dihydropteroate synthase